MSVLAQLKKFSENPEGPEYDREFLRTPGAGESGELEQTIQDVPIPGQSLTQDPDQKLPHEMPPRFTEQREFLDHLFVQLSSEDVLPKILDSMRKDVPVEDVALNVLKGQLRKGNVNTDLLMLSIEPTIYMLIAFATYAEIDPVLHPESDFDEEEANTDMAHQFRAAAQALQDGATPDEDPRLTVGDLNAPAVLPQSLMQRTQEAVGNIGDLGNTGEGEADVPRK